MARRARAVPAAPGRGARVTRRGARGDVHAPVPGLPLPGHEPVRSGGAEAALPDRGAARLDRALLMAEDRRAPRTLRSWRDRAQVVDAVLRAIVRVVGRAAAP